MKTLRFTAQQMIAALAYTRGMVTLAAERLNCSDETVYNYMKRYPSVQAEYHRQRERTLDITEQKLFDSASEGEAWAVQFLLRTKGKSRGYVERHEVTGKDGEALHIHLSWDDAVHENEDVADHAPALTPRPALRAEEPRALQDYSRGQAVGED